jgi:5,10-methylenetetrahydromethanopterin reductase
MSGRATFGLRIPPCRPATEVADCVRRTEEAGFDIAWIPDSQFVWRDVWATLALSAVASSSIRLGTCVTNFETRHASVTAAATGTLVELAPGRVILGVGTGDSAIKTLGLTPTRLSRMREEIALTRALLRGDLASWDGRSMRLEVVPSEPPPIYMAANAPKALALAGELCDGVILLAGLRREVLAAALEHVATGAARVGRSLSEVDVCVGTICHVTEDEHEAARIVKPYVVASAQTGGREALRQAGIEIDPPPVIAGIYPDMAHARDWDAAADAAGEWVSDELALRYADTFCLVGPPDHCVARLEEAVATGATSFYVRHPGSYTLPEELVRAFAAEIIPRFRVPA